MTQTGQYSGTNQIFALQDPMPKYVAENEIQRGFLLWILKVFFLMEKSVMCKIPYIFTNCGKLCVNSRIAHMLQIFTVGFNKSHPHVEEIFC